MNEADFASCFRSILPKTVILETAQNDDWQTPVYPQEEVLLKKAVEKRVREFRAGRHCAARVLNWLGVEQFPILQGSHREPLWPDHIVGAITHSGAVCAAAATVKTPLIASVGIDVEGAAPLESNLERLICTQTELEQVAELADHIPWNKVIFSVKESIFKAWYPLFSCYLDFLEATLTFHQVDSPQPGVTLKIHPNNPPNGIDEYLFEGQFRLFGDYVLSAVTASTKVVADDQ